MDEAELHPEQPSPGDGRRRRVLNHGSPFGWITGLLFGCTAGFGVLIGTVLGDCPAGGSCHAHDGALLLRGLALIGAAALALGFGVRAAINFAWAWLVRTGGLKGVGCVAPPAAMLIGLLAGVYWIRVMIALGI